MTTLDPTVDRTDHGARTDGAHSVDAAPTALVSILTSADHKIIGRTLIALSLLTTVITAALGVVLGLWRVSGDGDLLSTGVLGQLFSGYRLGLVFGGAIPLMLGICVMIVPLQLGARSLAFPRAAAAGMWTWLGGVVLVIIALFNDGGAGGTDADMVVLYVAATALLVIGLTAVAVSVATTVLTTRAPGMRLQRAPLFSWSALVYSLGLALVLPVSLGVTVYLYFDVRYGTAGASLFGGAAGIQDWAFWLLTGPSLALFAVPAVGFCAEVLPVVFGKRLPMRAVAMAGLALVGVGALAGAMQQQVIVLPGTGPAVDGHNFITKFGRLADWAILNLVPLLGILVVLAVGALLAKPDKAARLRGGDRQRFVAPFVLGLFGTLLVAAGLLANAVNGIEDLGLQGTVFEEGATVAIVYGTILAGLGAITYWAPKWTGRKLDAPKIAGIGLLGAAGAALAAGPYLIAGFADQPAFAVAFDYSGPSSLWNVLVLIGHAVFAVAALAVLGATVVPGRVGERAGDDPWSGQTLEWASTSPAFDDNFLTTPMVLSPEPLVDLKASNE